MGAVISVPIASCSSSISVGKLFISADVSTNAEEDQGQFKVNSFRRSKQLPEVTTDMSLGPCALPS